MDLGVDPSLVQLALHQAQSTLRVNKEALALIHELAAAKAQGTRPLKIYAMSNIAKEHMDIVQALPSFPWPVFDRIFTSFDAGMRKPDLSFYHHVIQETGCNPSTTLYLDDKSENICAGRLLGLRGEIVDPDQRTRAFNIVRNLLLEDASLRAERFLHMHAGKLDSVISMPGKDDIVLKDNFAQLMIWGLTGMEDIVYLTWPDGIITRGQEEADMMDTTSPTPISDASCSPSPAPSPSSSSTSPPSSPSPSLHHLEVKPTLWNYFTHSSPILTTTTFPPDIETTSIAYLTITPSHPNYHLLSPPSLIAEAMFAIRNKDGHFETYFSPDRHGRVSPEVCVSVLRCLNKFFSSGQIPGLPSLDVTDERIEPSKKLVADCLRYRANIYGNRFYPHPESFLYYLAMLCDECRDSSPKLCGELKGELEAALRERLNVPMNALALAMRVRAWQLLGLGRGFVQRDLESLLGMQEGDGGWPAGDFCSYGRVQKQRIGSRGWTTALVCRILRDWGM
ncbi:hypothetical protein QC762_606810 [Podospora pseudocomata]|uniref:Phosphatase n=1 Tax=Podospora pseudocomata TaxID=2093779 RepID=A0ABR0G8H1_9PEZI|nr:hypothetical protein QC762_606810 [Podospora pseudocomata]